MGLGIQGSEFRSPKPQPKTRPEVLEVEVRHAKAFGSKFSVFRSNSFGHRKFRGLGLGVKVYGLVAP